MTSQEAYNRIYNRLSGGLKVKLEVDPSVITDAIDESFKKVRQWYFEPDRAETLQVYGTGSQQYLLKSELTRTIRCIHKLYNTTEIKTSSGTLDSWLWGIDGMVMLDPGGLVLESYYVELAKSLEQFIGANLTFFETDTKILLSGDCDPNITVLYAPQPETFDEMTVQKSIDWCIDYAIAIVKLSLGRVRSKFRGGDLDVEMDGSDLISEGREDKTALEERLGVLDFRI